MCRAPAKKLFLLFAILCTMMLYLCLSVNLAGIQLYLLFSTTVKLYNCFFKEVGWYTRNRTKPNRNKNSHKNASFILGISACIGILPIMKKANIYCESSLIIRKRPKHTNNNTVVKILSTLHLTVFIYKKTSAKINYKVILCEKMNRKTTKV